IIAAFFPLEQITHDSLQIGFLVALFSGTNLETCLVANNNLKSPYFIEVNLVLPVWIEHTTSPLPRGCSTTELRQRECAGPARCCGENAAETATRSRVTQGDGREVATPGDRPIMPPQWKMRSPAKIRNPTAAVSAWPPSCVKICAGVRRRCAVARRLQPVRAPSGPACRLEAVKSLK